MAISVNFHGATLYKPGYYGDPNTPWFNNPQRKPLLLLLAKLGIKSANHYTFK